MKKRNDILTILVLLSLLIGGCAGAATEAPPAPEVEPETEVEVVEEPPAPPEPEPTAAPEETVDPFTVDELSVSLDIFIDDMEKYNTIGLEAFNTLLVENPDVFIMDVREESELAEKGWIPGAVHIPLRELADNLAALPSYDTTIVSYCGSGWRCTIALTALESLGWEDVLCLKQSSFGGWVEAGYPIETGDVPAVVDVDAVEVDIAAVEYWDEVLTSVPAGFGGIKVDDLNLALVEYPDLVLIDVRTPDEVTTKGYIDDAGETMFMPLQTFVGMLDDLPADLSTPISVYCGSGHRSTIAMTMLWAYGYTDVTSLKGGYSGWVDAGFTTVGGIPPAPDLDGAYAAFIAEMQKYNTISLDALNTMIVEGQTPFLLDVRKPQELLDNGWIEGAINIPLRELGAHLDLLPGFDTTIVSYCSGGWRCTIASAALGALGWQDVLALKGNSFTGWADAGYPVMTGTEIPTAEVLAAETPDEGMVNVIAPMLAGIPDGYGGITTDGLNTALVENPNLILIDVRRAEETTEKGIITADNIVLIPLEKFIEMKDLWPAADASIVVYCGSGHRSTQAMTILWSYGYTDVLSLKGGFSGWASAGYAVSTSQ